jgi:hypothetical protein
MSTQKRSMVASKGASSKSAKAGASMTVTQVSGAALDAEISRLDISTVGWNNLENKFNELQALISAPTSRLNASQARHQQKMTVSKAITKLLDMAQAECRRLLIEGNAKAAVEGGLKTLKLKEEYYGSGSLQLIPAYFHLARTNQFMDKFKRAEEFLSLAQYEILRHPEADVSLKAELHQTFGLLYASDGKLDSALKQLTCATYYLCAMNGPEHVLTSFGYFDLGNVFAAKSHMENAMAFYEKVKDIWHMHLTVALRLLLQQGTEQHQDIDAVLQYGTPTAFGDENVQDAVKMLRGIVGLQCERYGQVHPSTAKAEQVLGMFLLWNGDQTGASEELLRALEICNRVFGERHPTTGEVRALMNRFSMQIPEDTTGVLDDAAAAVDEAAAADAPEEFEAAPADAPEDAAPTESEVPVAAPVDTAADVAPEAAEEPAAEPSAEAAAEPAAEATAEPVAEPAAEAEAAPVAEVAAEPAAEPSAEETAEAADAPAADEKEASASAAPADSNADSAAAAATEEPATEAPAAPEEAAATEQPAAAEQPAE